MSRAYLNAAEAAAALGVRRATLYAYVSRGLVRSEPASQGRGRRYPAADVEALKLRVAGRADPPALARGALSWGVPVLDSGLTLISGGRVFYRGHEVTGLARRGETLERVAALLWLGSLTAPLPESPSLRLPPSSVSARARSWRPFQRLLVTLPQATIEDAAAYDLRPGSLVAAGTRLLPLLARLAAGPVGPAVAKRAGRRHPSAASSSPASAAEPPARTAAVLARGWAPATEGGELDEVTRLIDAALVLCADHELNISAFTARCVASARAPLAAVVLGGLAALGGSRHGGQSDRVEALFAEMAASRTAGGRASPRGDARTGGREGGRSTASGVQRGQRGQRGQSVQGVRERLADRLRRGEEIPGFGHPLYPEGDPRGRLLLDLAAAHRPRSPEVELALALAEAARDLLGEHPTLDFGLATLARVLGLPAGAPLGLFAIGRSAGWIAHALEQYADPRSIRPRARYTGPEPP